MSEATENKDKIEWIYKCGRKYKYCRDGFTGRYNQLKEDHKRPAVEMAREWLDATGKEWKSEAIRRRFHKLINVPKGDVCEICSEPVYETRVVDDLNALVGSGEKFGTIYADPPWQYSNQATRASTDNHYDTMTADEVAALPIAQLTADQAHLHLWTTNAFLFDCPKILESWGFEYKGVFVWVKPQMGIGNYWRVSHEFMVLGVKGGLRFKDHSQMSWLQAERTKHSRKPEEVYGIIERVSPGPYLELFGRRTRENWKVFGNEIKRELFNVGAFETALQN